MDSKRKSVGGEDRAAKKRRLLQEYNLDQGETPESTTQYGFLMLEQIRHTKDKSGRLVSLQFEKLPDDEEYIQRIQMPISLESIEKKLQNREFSTLSELESYVKRMVCNAKEWYVRNSVEHEDAERVRKALGNYMSGLNPAYKVAGYSAAPTPLPPVPPGVSPEATTSPPASVSARKTPARLLYSRTANSPMGSVTEESEKVTAPIKTNAATIPNVILRMTSPTKKDESSPQTPGDATTDMSLPGSSKTSDFQEAQERIVATAIRRRDTNDTIPHFAEFHNLPSRSLKEYYAVIEQPMCLKKLQKMVCGYRGKQHPATGVSEFTTWDAFAETASLLWKNAFAFNEDESEISRLARELRDYFQEEIKAARVSAPEPGPPPTAKIRLKVPQSEPPAPVLPKITLHVTGRGTAAATATATATAAANSHAPAATTNGIASGSGKLPIITLAQPNSVKARALLTGLPPLGPLSNRPRDPSEDPVSSDDNSPSGDEESPASVVAPTPEPVAPTIIPAPVPAPPKPVPMEDTWRQACNYLQDGGLTFVALRSSAGDPPAFKHSVIPDAARLQQGFVLHVPHGETQLQLSTRISPIITHDKTQYKLFVLCNNMILFPASVDGESTHLFEPVLVPGRVNTVEIHLAVTIPKSVRRPDGPSSMLEKVVFYLNSLKS